MARGKQPSVSHALPKQQSLLDCFLEAQAKRTKRRRRSSDGAASAGLLNLTEDTPADDEAGPTSAGIKTAGAI
ncbi:conserved protein of unknown function [Bradyrhizobium sp. ORS 285]|nr:conserved protein of unknown function [Bradyrhizobium sp. ORS 285]